MIQLIKDVIDPKNDTSRDIDELIEHAMGSSDNTSCIDDQEKRMYFAWNTLVVWSV